MHTKPDYNYLDNLNPQQRAAVEYCDGASLVIAGAGSGKTRVLTYKIVHLLRLGFEPHRILALTFTNKAAREMKSRVAEMVGEKLSQRIWMGTFHSIFLRILRRHAELLGFRPGFTIYDSADSRSLIKLIIRELGLDEKQYKPASVASTISNAKNSMMTAGQYIAQYGDVDRKQKRPMTGRIFQLYTQRCLAANAMDFDDILFYMNLLLRDNPDICRHYREFFRFILVDEYQDTNFAQHMVITQLSRPGNRICVVGDDAQSIYSFRGANIGNIINLERSFPGLKTFRLERNYRSTRNIVNAAGSLIKRNTRQLKKEVYSENEEGVPVEIVRTYSDIEEAYIVAHSIANHKLSEHDSYEDYAVLYRTNAQSRVIEEALRKQNINYRLVGGTAFYQRKEVKDVISYFRLAINPDDDEALRRIINFPTRGIGETTLKKLQVAASAAGVSIWKVLGDPEKYPVDVNSGTRKKLDAFYDMIAEFTEENKTSDAYELGQLIFNRTGILMLYEHDNAPESIARQENLMEILNGLHNFVEAGTESGETPTDMAAFLSEVMLATDADEKEHSDEPKVTLMTVHAAKGLEFKHVYIVGAEEELFPSAMAMNSIAEIEEERRLMYVAITRAKKHCTITYAKTRFRNGQTKLSSPSRFISELDPRFVSSLSSSDSSNASNASNEINRYETTSRMRKVNEIKSDFFSPLPQHAPNELNIGMKIEHAKLGTGVITDKGHISGEPSITVDFGATGVKRLLLKFAKFKILK
ncbi:MAG: UvrD-helicase domain-containing protein [Candidatus Amulumruptor caecigallinarius]|nr:UvrD-helicase domain-containing protein [Candidatus Amulumruptor caecigallinarius]